MSDDSSFDIPTVADKDICWASGLLKLGDNAFYGEDRNDPRQEILKSMAPIDIAACPGSGKTTLLVAKLAILGEKWKYRTRGICVLCHTNAARHQIESRLGNTTIGRRLLAYPHYIGTIHGFVDKFLALPWLRSKGYRIKMIDSEICHRRRWAALPFKIRQGLEKNHHKGSILCVKSPEFDLGKVRWGKGTLNIQRDAYRAMQDVCKRSFTDGYFCYDEMFMWARNFMEKFPGTIHMIQNRFPLLFIDEAQDNSEEQSAILHNIFMSGNNDEVIRQRFGDANQAIFDFVGAKKAITDKFPIDSLKRDLPNSHRFGQKIADLADPLGIDPYTLKGHGPKKPFASGMKNGQHTIFLFDDSDVDKVLNAYADLLVETFTAEELREGIFTAVGQVHKPPDKEESHKYPHHVGHYWPCYDPELSSREPKPQTFMQYVVAGVGKAEMAGEAFPAVEKIAEGILRLAGMLEGGASRPRRRHSHRYVLTLLEECGCAGKNYEDLIAKFAVERENPTKETWSKHWRGVVCSIAKTITGASQCNSEATSFLEWKDGPDDSVSPPITPRSQENIFRFSKNGKEVAVRVGSVHSVKGETHTATLVLETFWNDHNLESIKDWLYADKNKKGYAGPGVRIPTRLRIHYVAMTRPTHLLCLAMKRSTFEDNKGSVNHHAIGQLKARGWQVKEV